MMTGGYGRVKEEVQQRVEWRLRTLERAYRRQITRRKRRLPCSRILVYLCDSFINRLNDILFIRVLSILSLGTFCPGHYFRDIFSGDILSGHATIYLSYTIGRPYT